MKPLKQILHIISSFFCDSDGNFQVLYFWISLLMCCIITGFIQILRGQPEIKEVTLISLMGMVVALLGVYQWNKKSPTAKPLDVPTTVKSIPTVDIINQVNKFLNQHTNISPAGPASPTGEVEPTDKPQNI